MFRRESQLGLARAERCGDQDSRSIKLQCVSCRSSHNTLWRCAPRVQTRTHAGRASIGMRIALAPSRNRSAKRTPAWSVRMHQRRAFEVVSSPSSQCGGRREMHSRGNASCHSRRPPRDNKLSGLCIGRKQRRTFHMQNRTCAPQVPRAPELVVPGAKTRPVVSSEKWSRWQSMQRFAEAAGSAALPFASFLDRSLCLDRSIALSGESVWVSAVSQAACDCVGRQG